MLALCQATAETKTQAEPLVELPVCRFFLLAKVVDLDPCLAKKPLEEKPSLPYSARESLSEVQSLSSFQSESCDDNGEAAELGAAGLAFSSLRRRGVVSSGLSVSVFHCGPLFTPSTYLHEHLLGKILKMLVAYWCLNCGNFPGIGQKIELKDNFHLW